MVGLLGKQMLVKWHITLEKTFNLGVSSINIEVKYLVVEATSPYNVILGRHTFNLLGVSVPTFNLSLTYALRDRHMGKIKGNQTFSQ